MLAVQDCSNLFTNSCRVEMWWVEQMIYRLDLWEREHMSCQPEWQIALEQDATRWLRLRCCFYHALYEVIRIATAAVDLGKFVDIELVSELLFGLRMRSFLKRDLWKNRAFIRAELFRMQNRRSSPALLYMLLVSFLVHMLCAMMVSKLRATSWCDYCIISADYVGRHSYNPTRWSSKYSRILLLFVDDSLLPAAQLRRSK